MVNGWVNDFRSSIFPSTFLSLEPYSIATLRSAHTLQLLPLGTIDQSIQKFHRRKDCMSCNHLHENLQASPAQLLFLLRTLIGVAPTLCQSCQQINIFCLGNIPVVGFVHVRPNAAKGIENFLVIPQCRSVFELIS